MTWDAVMWDAVRVVALIFCAFGMLNLLAAWWSLNHPRDYHLATYLEASRHDPIIMLAVELARKDQIGPLPMCADPWGVFARYLKLAKEEANGG